MFVPASLRLVSHLYILIWILIFPIPVTSQVLLENLDTFTQQQLIKGCALYRNNFIHNIVEGLIDFNMLCDSLKSVSGHPEGHDLFRERVMNKCSQWDYQDMNSMIDAAIPTSIWDKNVRGLYKDWGNRYFVQIVQFSFLLANSIIEPVEPYKLTTLSDFWKELNYYNLKAGQVFVDVGAGIGSVSFILALSGFPIYIHVTEIDERYLSYLQQQANSPSFIDERANFQVDTGRSKSLGLQSQVIADRILMREVFHHLKYPDEVLQSVKSHLSENGVLILVESTKDLNANGKERCNKAMEPGHILKIVSDNGFDLEEKKIVGTSYLMKFKVRD